VVAGRRWRLVIAIDGKVERGARLPDGRQVHLLSAYDTHAGIDLAQVQIAAKSNEIPAFSLRFAHKASKTIFFSPNLSGILGTASLRIKKKAHAGGGTKGLEIARRDRHRRLSLSLCIKQ
jgi:hypothetical protein